MKAFGVFEGGGAKGYAHIGALHAIEARGIELEAVAGSSIGAVIALLVAAGFTADDLFSQTEVGSSGLLSTSWIEHLNQKDWAAFEKFRAEYLTKPWPQVSTGLGIRTLARVGLSTISAYWRHSHVFQQLWTRFGLTDTAGFRQWLEEALREKLKIVTGPVLFRHLKIPLKVVAGDLLSGKMRVFGNSGDADLSVVDAAIASASYPLFFQPFAFEGSFFVDGGLLSNLPAWVFDEERLTQTKLKPTFGFRFADLPLGRPSDKKRNLASSLPAFLKQLADTSIFGGQAIGARGIEDYYAFDLVAEIETLAFHEIKSKAARLVETGRKGVASFFDSQIGPSDSDDMEVLLQVVANFIVQAFDRGAKVKVRTLRTFIIIKSSPDLIRVVYSANATEDADDRLKIRADSPGTAESLKLREAVITFVPEISDAIRTSPVFKYEHAARPNNVTTIYTIPIFADPDEWSKENPGQRKEPIAALVVDSQEDIRYLLQLPEFEDRLTTYAQICGEHLKGTPVGTFGFVSENQPEASQLIPLEETGFFVSDRKSRSLFQDDEARDLVERVDERIRMSRASEGNHH